MKMKDGILYADEGLVLTNGREYGKTVFPAANADLGQWWEISAEEAELLEPVPAEIALAELKEVLA